MGRFKLQLIIQHFPEHPGAEEEVVHHLVLAQAEAAYQAKDLTVDLVGCPHPLLLQLNHIHPEAAVAALPV
jgi:hypothetical protein